MKVLILGASGMLGHTLCQRFANRFETYATLRQGFSARQHAGIFAESRIVPQVSVENFDSLIRAIAVVRPAVVINCIGIIKQLEAAKDPLLSISINALFPHRLAQVCQAASSRLIQIGTDCVFSGRKGSYTEDDISDAEDLYGRTKFLGEVAAPNCLTLRTSIIGRELHGKYGLFEWFLSQKGQAVKGFAKAIYTGFTTLALADIIGRVIEQFPELSGVWQVSSESISKYALLTLVNQVFQLGITIEKDETFRCDRSLNSDRFRQATGYVPPTWRDMITQLHNESELK